MILSDEKKGKKKGVAKKRKEGDLGKK